MKTFVYVGASQPTHLRLHEVQNILSDWRFVIVVPGNQGPSAAEFNERPKPGVEEVWVPAPQATPPERCSFGPNLDVILRDLKPDILWVYGEPEWRYIPQLQRNITRNMLVILELPGNVGTQPWSIAHTGLKPVAIVCSHERRRSARSQSGMGRCDVLTIAPEGADPKQMAMHLSRLAQKYPGRTKVTQFKPAFAPGSEVPNVAVEQSLARTSDGTNTPNATEGAGADTLSRAPNPETSEVSEPGARTEDDEAGPRQRAKTKSTGKKKTRRNNQKTARPDQSETDAQ